MLKEWVYGDNIELLKEYRCSIFILAKSLMCCVVLAMYYSSNFHMSHHERVLGGILSLDNIKYLYEPQYRI